MTFKLVLRRSKPESGAQRGGTVDDSLMNAGSLFPVPSRYCLVV